ncbi:bacteriocin immunity protein [Streptococcus iniae]|uniref:bacteriocin immunity protein n=1 Tax=Streptococcus iniae TaxID=1346 RepID=UPI0008D9B651|nr:bacteriocin immunity protein [Streptococcus iniae]OHX26411.1 bacteriocin immunity protein [Streptococcus iniae]RLV28684.1 bacteriocin immunity protein [Streptococcus iniae]
MIKKHKSSEWLSQIDDILKSDCIKHNKALVAIFLRGKKAIAEGEQNALARLSNDISWYLVVNKYEAPEPVIDFAQKIAKEPHKLRGKLALLQMLARSFIQK